VGAAAHEAHYVAKLKKGVAKGRRVAPAKVTKTGCSSFPKEPNKRTIGPSRPGSKAVRYRCFYAHERLCAGREVQKNLFNTTILENPEQGQCYGCQEHAVSWRAASTRSARARRREKGGCCEKRSRRENNSQFRPGKMVSPPAHSRRFKRWKNQRS